MFVLFIVTIFAPSAAARMFHPSRFRLLAHGGTELSEGVDLRTHLIANFPGEFAPNVDVGVAWRPLSWLGTEVDLGWSFRTDEPIVTADVSPAWGQWWAWMHAEFQPKSRGGYYFVQGERTVTSWIDLGVESEGWGGMQDVDSWSHGLGPNALIHFGDRMRVDLALHAREMHGLRPEFFVRWHLFL